MIRVANPEPFVEREDDDMIICRCEEITKGEIRLAVYEMLYEEDVPAKVAINEAVELAKQYGTDNSPSFVNGVLAKLV